MFLLPILFANNILFLCHRTAKFGLLRKGEYISVSAVFNTHTKFGKLAVGKHVASTKLQHGSGNSIFPLVIALNDLSPITKVWVDYEPQPKNIFKFRVNDADIYTITKEEIDYDPTKTEMLNVKLNVND